MKLDDTTNSECVVIKVAIVSKYQSFRKENACIISCHLVALPQKEMKVIQAICKNVLYGHLQKKVQYCIY